MIGKPFSWPVRVYYEDTDAAGVVYYANYLRFMERARTEWLRALGFEQPDLAARYRIVFVVRGLSIDYIKPSQFNDSLAVTVELADVGGVRLTVRQRVLRGEEAVAEADVRLACVHAESFRPVRIPRIIITSMEQDQ